MDRIIWMKVYLDNPVHPVSVLREVVDTAAGRMELIGR
jgi:hypothetical protein